MSQGQITVKIQVSDGRFSYESVGHAGGQPLVCAAFGALEFSFLNSVSALTKIQPYYRRERKASRLQAGWKLPSASSPEGKAVWDNFHAVFQMYLLGLKIIDSDETAGGKILFSFNGQKRIFRSPTPGKALDDLLPPFEEQTFRAPIFRATKTA